MALERKFSSRTGWINYPPGVSPADKKGIEFAQDAIMNMLDADDVKVSFPVNDNNQPLLHKMQVEVYNHPKKGQLLNTAGIDSDVAQALGDLIEDLANDSDPQSSLDTIKEKVEGEGGEEKPDEKDKDKDKPEGDEDSSDESSGKPNPFKGNGDLPKPDEEPTPGKGLVDKKPFASRNANKPSAIKRAVQLEKEYGVPINEGVKLCRRIDKTANSNEGLSYLRREIRDEDNSALDKRDYLRIAEITSGEQRPLA